MRRGCGGRMAKKPAYGSHGALDFDRAEDDFYRSPPHAMDMLLDAIHPVKLTYGAILDAGAGDGRLTEPLMRAGYDVTGVDLHDRNPPPYLPIVPGVNFLAEDVSFQNVECVVMNPPYNLADRFIRRALKIVPVGGTVHALLRHTWMTGLKREDLLPLMYRIVMCRRLKMLPAELEHEDKGHSGAVDFSWFSFERGRTSGRPEILQARRQETGDMEMSP